MINLAMLCVAVAIFNRTGNTGVDSIEAAHDGLLILFTRRADLMGALVNRRATTVVASVIAAVIITLNVFLIGDTLLGSSPITTSTRM